MSKSANDVARTYAGTAGLSTSDYHELLAANRRRVVLDVLADRTTPVDLEDLAAAIAAREADGDRTEKEAVEQVALCLHHNHLPKIAEFGVIDYDPEARRVESSPDA